MIEERILRAHSRDGTEIAGRVRGAGPAIVLVHGGLGDDDSWRFMLPFLETQYTCYAMSTRGRGLSSDHIDHSWECIVEDVQAFAEGVGEPVGLVGHSSGGALALEAASRTDAIAAIGLYEPTVFELGEEMREPVRDQRTFGRIGELADEGRLADAAQMFLEDIALANDQELEAVAAAGATEIMGPNVPPARQEVAQSGPPHLTDLALLERVTLPVLLLQGTRTHPFYTRVAERLAERLPMAHVREIEGLGHLGPVLAPESVAKELAAFFSETLAPA